MLIEELDRLQALCDAATEGPWNVDKWSATKEPAGVHADGSGETICAFPDEDNVNDTGNAPFIAVARAALPALITEVKRLRRPIEIADENGLIAQVVDGEVKVFREWVVVGREQHCEFLP